MILQYLYGQGPIEDIFGSEKSAGEVWTPASFFEYCPPCTVPSWNRAGGDAFHGANAWLMSHLKVHELIQLLLTSGGWIKCKNEKYCTYF